MASPSSIRFFCGDARTAATISGTRAVTSLRLRVKTRTSSPCLCTCTRAPSSFHSSAAVPSVRSASSMAGADCDNIGSTGCMSRMENRASASAPSCINACATPAMPPAAIAALRASASLTPLAAATASSTSACSAPWRNSPTIRRGRKSCSSGVARASNACSSSNRFAVAPAPVIDASSPNAASTSAMVNCGVPACAVAPAVRSAA